VHLKTYLFSKRFYKTFSPELAAYDGIFLVLRQLFRKKVSRYAVYEFNDIIEQYYGCENSEEQSKELTDKYIDELNRMEIESSNRSLAWYPEIKWNRLTEDEDKNNLIALQDLLLTHYSSKKSITLKEFEAIFAEYKEAFVLDDGKDASLSKDDINQAHQARVALENNFLFGRFLQEKGKGALPIEWIKISETEKTALYVSKKVLAVRRIHSINNDVVWDDCELKEWLETYFYKKAFNKAERSLLMSHSKNKRALFGGLFQKKPNISTANKKVSLLSLDEVEDHLDCLETTDIETLELPPTPILHPVYGISTTSRKPQNNAWWLRTPAKNKNSHYIVVYYEGTIHNSGYHFYNAKCGVRPVILVENHKKG
jgi:hypothetical protein